MTTSTLGKLINHTPTDGGNKYDRGDFRIITGELSGIVIRNVSITSSNEITQDRFSPGTMFTISNLPLRSDDENLDSYKNYVVSARTSHQLTATIMESRSVDRMKNTATSSTENIMNEIASIFSGTNSQCRKAPATLKEAVKAKKGVGGSNDTKFLPTSGNRIRTPDGEVMQDGGFLDMKPDGGMTFSIGGNGMVITESGDVTVPGKLALSKPETRPHTVAGIPSKKLPLVDVSPRMIFNPVIDQIPDLNLVNWVTNMVGVITFVVNFTIAQSEGNE